MTASGWPAFAAASGAARGLLVLAPHPDDETLGCGGLIALAAGAGVPVTVAYLTDGEASHPNSRAWPPARLAALRREEAAEACRVLGVTRPPVFLGLPDAGTLDLPRERVAEADDRLRALIGEHAPGLIVTTWPGEPHCDHVFAGEAARRVAGRLPVLSYEVWGRLEETERSPAARGAAPLALRLGPEVVARRRRALARHRSQLGEVVTDDPGGFVLSREDAASIMGPVETYWRGGT